VTRELGLAVPLEGPLPDVLSLAAEAEGLGYRWLWVNDDRLQKDPFATLAAMALGTQHAHLGVGVTNPYSRHPALIATAIATVDELSGGRAVLGLGAGGTNHAALDVRRESPAGALRDAIAVVRGLLAGERVTVQGRVVRAREARLDFAPTRTDVPIYVGSRGPRVLELAGAAADGVIVGNVATPEGWAYALGRIEAGAGRAGRTIDDVRLVAWLYTCVADDGDAALDAIRPMAATSLVTSRPILGELGIEMPDAFARAMESHGWSLAADVVAETGRLLPEEIVRRFGIAGTAGDCRARLDHLLDEVPQIAQVTIVPFGAGDEPAAATARRFIAEVAVGSVVDAGTGKA
jgi:5,10-methylenetetrahydromethanopterin reductase